MSRGGSAEGTSQIDILRIKNPYAPTIFDPNKNPELSKFGLTPPSGHKLFLKITIFSTFFHFFDLRLVSNGHQ